MNWKKCIYTAFSMEVTQQTCLCGILGQWDILLLNLTSIGFTNFFRCLIFDLSFFTNADFVTIKDETLKKIRETDAGSIDFHWFHEFWPKILHHIIVHRYVSGIENLSIFLFDIKGLLLQNVNYDNPSWLKTRPFFMRP